MCALALVKTTTLVRKGYDRSWNNLTVLHHKGLEVLNNPVSPPSLTLKLGQVIVWSYRAKRKQGPPQAGMMRRVCCRTRSHLVEFRSPGRNRKPSAHLGCSSVELFPSCAS